jgi:uncharacterized protein YutE (UPF0331/DUF86 family)/predicted nucleotidyltransferase
MKEITQVLHALASHIQGIPAVEMAFAFGSRINGTSTNESDLDIAVYYTPSEVPFDFETDTKFPGEEELWGELEHIAGLSIDLVVLNRAPATLGYAVIQTGTPLLIRNVSLCWGYYLTASREAEDFRAFTEEYWRIKQRSTSLSEMDRSRLVRIIDFLESEMRDYDSLKALTRESYGIHAPVRRNAERFAENIVNASIDIAKIVLASSGLPIPQTYGEVLSNLSLIEGFDTKSAGRLSAYAKLRNVLAHEYLEIRFERVSDFIFNSRPFYQALVDYVKKRYFPTTS